ncbi:MAG: L-seryl-tRNA(Sec) selenium transferase [Phycisphaerales bacterium]|nr:L-seryl-tRNA(Sec) selenium transferase [Phycisphaerales bacterium]
MNDSISKLLRTLPAVSEFLTSPTGQQLCSTCGEGVIKHSLRQTLDELRHAIRTNKQTTPISLDHLITEVTLRAQRLTQPQARQAINATGILLHTGLGRAPMCNAAIQALQAAAEYTPLQASLDSGDRSLREARVEQLLQELIGCEAATVVNNNAAATMLILNTLAATKEVIISRGQLIEIGGSFRMTDVMAQSNAILREVGTTNRTHLRDYQAAINENTAALIHVHTSNYRIRGFASTPTITELAELAHKHNLPVIDDLGSGAIVPLSSWGISDEPLVKDSLAAGADVVCFSGDKLICGPQSGIICGKKSIIERIRKNPYARMFRVCKLTLAALEATLVEFLNNTYRENIPFYRMLSRSAAELDKDAQFLQAALTKIQCKNLTIEITDDLSYVGSGSIPDEGIPTRILRLRHTTIPSAELARRLRSNIPPIFTRLSDRDLVIDLRTLREGDADQVAIAIQRSTAR